MNLSDSMTIKTKIGLFSVVMIIVLVITNYLAYQRISEQAGLFDETVNIHYQKTIAVNNIIDSINTIARNTRNIALFPNDEKEFSDSKKRVNKSLLALDQNMAFLERFNLNYEEKELFQSLKSSGMIFKNANIEIMDKFLNGEIEEAKDELIYGLVRKSHKEMFEACYNWLDFETKMIEDNRKKAESFANSQIYFSIASVAVSTIIALIATFILNRLIAIPIERAMKIANEIAKGNLSVFD